MRTVHMPFDLTNFKHIIENVSIIAFYLYGSNIILFKFRGLLEAPIKRGHQCFFRISVRQSEGVTEFMSCCLKQARTYL